MHALLLTLLLVFTLPTNEAKTCSSIDVRNTPEQLEKLRNCTIIAGYLRVLLIENSNRSFNAFNNYSFPELREVTDHVIFYRVRMLTSLGQLFPNLAIIRGNVLLLDTALTIYEMADLQEIGLYGLLEISRGNVRISKNPHICYMNQINWKIILDGQVITNENGQYCNYKNSCPDQCVHGCWNSKKCQKVFDQTCTGDCLSGCKPNGECELCKHYIEDKRCVSRCSKNRYLAKHLAQCITEEECRSLKDKDLVRKVGDKDDDKKNEKKWFIYGQDCLDKCPPKYEKRNGTCKICEKFCHKLCSPNTMITDIESMQEYNGCTNITGNLMIRLDKEMRGDIEHELEKNLGYIEQIDGFLKIIRSLPIKNLNFFKNLHTIKGTTLEKSRYSLVVHENQNLQQLWDGQNSSLRILNGTFFFHNNPKLCPSEIEHLAKLANLRLNYSYVDVSNSSNGDSFACASVTIKARALNITENSAVIEWSPPTGKDCKNVASRFLIDYKEVDDDDMFSEEEECGIPTWMTLFAYNIGNEITCDTVLTYNITELRTFTNYTYFIRTDGGGRSEILYFMTLSGDPSVPMIVKAEPSDSDGIRLIWEKPNILNGILSHYILVGFIQDERQSFIDQRDYCKVKMIETTTTTTTTTTESIIETTTEADVPQTSETCECNSKKEDSMVTLIQKEDFDVICSTLDKVTYKAAKGVQSHGCGSYKYQVIPSHNPHSGFGFGQENIIEKREETTIKPDTKTNEQIKNGVYHLFEKRIEANESSFVMNQLKHYSIYILLLSACNENRTEVAQCSAIAMISERTGRKEDADDIEDVLVRITNMFDVEIEWLEPPNPNSVIVSYDIQYKNLNNSREVSECITRRQHQQSNYRYKLRNLSPGQYQVQVRATSLAGPGNPSPLKMFYIVRPSQISPVISIVVALILLLCVSIGTYVFWRLKIKRSIDHRQLIANVNPDYAGYQEDEWEIEMENVEIYHELGQGTFGQVFSGYIKNKHIPCAIKTVNEKSTMHDRMEFLNEATIMKAFNEAHHVVRLLGVISRGPQPYVVMELMARGDLKSFLRTTRDSSTSLTCSEMYRMAAEIADGMSYLSAKKFVHRDLAARNCMVSGDRTVKIGDFGMTRDIYETDYYRKETRGLLPVRWMAPESLADGVFTSDSDVWSYGIVLWEIATLSEQPYQGLANEQVLQYVVAKGVLERPAQCPDLLYEIMAACWKWYPFQRPLFIDVVENLENHIGQDFRLVSFYHSRDGEEYRRNKAEINRERAMHMGAIPEGRVFWNRNDDSVHFEADSPSASPASVSLLSCQQHSLPNEYSPNPGTSYKPRLGG